MREANDRVPASIIGLPIISRGKTVQSQERVIRSHSSVEDIRSKLRENYGLKFTYSQISNHISLSMPKGEPDIIEVAAQAELAERASALADIAAEVYTEKVKEMEKADNIILIEQNVTGQLGRLLREKTGIKIDKENRILKYDTRPFYSDDLRKEIERRLK